MKSGGLDFGYDDGQERADVLTTTGRFKARCQVVQEIAAPLLAGGYNRPHSHHEPAPLHAVGPATDSTPDHRLPQRSLGRVIRRIEPLHPGEGPQSFLRLEDLEARRCRLGARAPRPFLKGLLDLASQAGHSALESTPVQGSVTHPEPVAEQSVRQRQPRFFLLGSAGGFRFNPIGSDEGGLEELSFSRFSRSLTRASSCASRCS